jgi:multiple sugar transport system substrate-binding protein
VAAALAVGLGLLAACSTAAPTIPTTPDDPNAVLTVWIDQTREAAVKAYQAKHPEAKLNVVVTDVGAGKVLQKAALSNKANEGWPDVTFLADPGDISALAVAPLNYAQALNDLVPEATRKQFAAGTLENCTYNGKVYCLQNDIAQSVLWYNDKLMKQFGYEVPKTWAAYQALGIKLATEHPGYLIGGVNGRDFTGIFLGSSGCTSRAVTDPTHISIKVSDSSCTRVTKLLDPLVKNGTVANFVPWDKAFTENFGAADKVLMYPNASWFGDFGFNGAWKIPSGELAAAPMPTWDGEDKPYAGAAGGGLWVVSAHTKNKKGAADLITFLSTDLDLAKSSPTYPAFGPGADAWCAAKASDTFYASDPCPAMKSSAPLIRSNYSYIRFESQYGDIFAQSVGTAATNKGDLTEALLSVQDKLVQAAQNASYTVAQ